MEVAHIVHGNFKVHANRPNLFPAFSGIRVLQCHFNNYSMLNSSLEFLNGPFPDLFLLLVFIQVSLDTFRNFKSHVSCLSWHWELYKNLSCKMIRRESSPHFQSQLQLVLGKLVYKGINSKGSGVVSIYSVIHDQELAIGGIDR